MAHHEPQRLGPGPRRSSLRLTEFDYAASEFVYFITMRARPGIQLTATPGLGQAIVEALLWRRERQMLRLYAYCLMPDHIHLAVSPLPAGSDASHLLQGFKSRTTREAWQRGIHGAIWQRSYYDHIARREEDCRAICQYILENPVRKGLVREASEWPFSGLPDPLPG